mmetsp:Transcript_14674/g.20453  ORF Transcript_14674/g.20453 Transcript_14674/m.20453 type:complete len:124 (+) Transcript_14674:28-399(+)
MNKLITFALLALLCSAYAIDSKVPISDDEPSNDSEGATVTFVNDSDIPINFQVWTAGKVFLVSVCNTYPGSKCQIGVDCVWYDLYAINMNNTVAGDVIGAYCGGTYCLLGAGNTYVLGQCSGQ